MKTEDLSFVADALLAMCESPRKAPFYTEYAWMVKLRQEQPKERLYIHLASCRRDDELLRTEYAAIFDSANLTERQADVLARRLDGWTFEEIGAETGNTKQNAQNVFVQALKKLTLAFHVYPYRGLSDTYRCEVRRGHF